MWYTAALIRSSLPRAHVPIFWDFLLGCRVHAARLFGQGRVPRNSLFRAALLALHSQPSPRRRVVEHTKRQPKAAHAEPKSGTIFRTVLRSVAPSLEVPVWLREFFLQASKCEGQQNLTNLTCNRKVRHLLWSTSLMARSELEFLQFICILHLA